LTLLKSNHGASKKKAQQQLNFRITSRISKPVFRSIPRIISEDDVKNMLNNLKLFDVFLNNRKKQFRNEFQESKYNNKILIYDKSCHLMWQQGGSGDTMNIQSAREYVEYLNEKKYANFTDWRLPTLEEAMSLMESARQKNGIYLNPVFDKSKPWIWTCDIWKVEWASCSWVVDYENGDCSLHMNRNTYYYAKAVRNA
jgi:hypothetical protein